MKTETETETETKRHLIKFFINKFTAIPSRRWCVGKLSDGHGHYCALGHLGWREGGPMMAEQKRHQIKFFINKFEAIPEQQWCEWVLFDTDGRKCALGHTMQFFVTEETKSLCSLFGETENDGWVTVANTNNGLHPDYRQATPRQRILAALHDKLKECL